MTAAALVRQGRRAHDFSQRELATASAISQPAIAAVEAGHRDLRTASLERLLRAAGAQLVLLPTTATPAAAAADAIYECLRHHDERRAFRHFIGLADGLAGEHGALRVALCAAPAPPVGDSRFDAALAGLVEYRLAAEGLPLPAWVDEPWRRCAEPWVVSTFSGPDLDRITPEPFRRRGVLIDPAELVSV